MLAPQQSQVVGIAEEHRLQSASSTVSVSEKGFFHFVDVTPGSYVVSASQQGYATAEAYGVRVLEGSEAILARDLVMKPPLSVELHIEPPLDPAGRQWVVSLVRQGPETGYKREVAVRPATESGLWRAEQLMPGTYTIVVKDVDESRWVSKEYELLESSSSIPVQVPLLSVFGMVVMGEEGVPATLWFGTMHGTTSIRMACDEEGLFQGFLPREGTWKVSVQSRNPSVQSTVNVDVVADQELLIPLADTVVQGTVKDVNGAVVPDARVEISPLEVKSLNIVYTDEEGKFEARGFIGRVNMRARFQRLSSQMESLEISEDENEHTVELILQDETIIEGVVTTPFGAAMGASVVVIPVGGEVVRISVISTDASGAFAIGVPATTRTANLTVMAPGYALRLVQVGLPTAGPMLINLQQGGGTLILELQADQSSRGIPGVVFSEGAFVPVGILLRWLAMNSMRMTDRSLITVPNVHPGTYSLCSGASTSSNCSPVAYLSEGGSERLKIPVDEESGG
jgi:hypothetical protein